MKDAALDTKPYRQKYEKRKHGRTIAHPPGGGDVIRLCDAVDSLIQLVREIQAELPINAQAEVQRKLLEI